jgi:hypothetical protein
VVSPRRLLLLCLVSLGFSEFALLSPLISSWAEIAVAAVSTAVPAERRGPLLTSDHRDSSPIPYIVVA